MTDHRERMVRGERYRCLDPQLVADRQAAELLAAEFSAAAPADPLGARKLLDRLLGGLAEGAEVKAPFRCAYGYNIRLGAGSFINYDAILLDCGLITIGEEVAIGPRVQLATAIHPLDPVDRRAGWETTAPITIRDGAWLGAGVIVCPGVTIGENTVVGAGSVVTRDLPDRVVAVGNPCRVRREIP
ncbi:MAG: maltose O-acetyltransferase [Streptomyces sp.]|nr:maltose O-acetyltransferase [Streptomyces sp.]